MTIKFLVIVQILAILGMGFTAAYLGSGNLFVATVLAILTTPLFYIGFVSKTSQSIQREYSRKDEH